MTIYDSLGATANLFADNETTALNNPFTVSDVNYDSDGSFWFKADNGDYDIKVVSGGVTTWKYGIYLTDSTIMSISRTNKADAVQYEPINGKMYFIGGTDGGWFKGVTGGSGYADNGGAYCGTAFIPTGGDGSSAYLRDYNGAVDPAWYGAVIASDASASFVLAYADSETVVVDKAYIATNFTLSKTTEFKDAGKLTITGTFTISANIIAPNIEVFDTSAVTSYTITSGSLYEIKPLWFSDDFGTSQTVEGYKCAEALLGTVSNYNQFHGYRCGEKTNDAIESHFSGTFAGASCIHADLSTGVGYGALRGKENPPSSGAFDNTSADNTVALGQGTLQDGTSHTNSTAVGSGCGRDVGISVSFTAVGVNAGRLGGDLSNVVLIGAATGYNLGSTGAAADSQYTTYVGSDIGFNITQDTKSTLIGARSGLYSTICDNNTWNGYLTGPDSGTYSTVSSTICIGSVARTRVDDSITIGNSVTETVAGRIRIGTSADQTSTMLGPLQLTIGDTSGASIFVGTGSPEGVTTSGVGGLFLRTDGGASTTMYVKESGAGNTGWIGK